MLVEREGGKMEKEVIFTCFILFSHRKKHVVIKYLWKRRVVETDF